MLLLYIKIKRIAAIIFYFKIIVIMHLVNIKQKVI